jgi:hypothetical protein
MARVDTSLRRKRQDFLSDAGEELLAIAAGQVPSSEAASEKNISSKERTFARQVKAQAAGAVARYFENVEVETAHRKIRCFADDLALGDGLDFQGESPISKEVRLRDHRYRVCMVINPAIVAPLDRCGVGHVIEMSMGEEKGVDPLAREVPIGSLGGINEDIS